MVKSINSLKDDVTLAEGANVTITSADNTLTIAATGGVSGWGLTGNAGTEADTNFLGTTDSVPMILKVNNVRVFRLEPGSACPNIIGGYTTNSAADGISGATIGGGGEAGMINSVTAAHGTIGGGKGNTASGSASTVGGGSSNTASGDYATIPGGYDNTALGDYSFAGGRRARANHAGCFVWGDSTDADINSTLPDQFVVSANGGAWFLVDAGGLFIYPNDISPNVIAGYVNNGINSGVVGAAISGGGVSGAGNWVTDNYGAVGGGKGNVAGDDAGDEVDATHATISGGQDNTASAMYAVIGGGWDNIANGFCATVSGGGRSDAGDANTRNHVTDNYGTVGGGGDNQAGDDTDTDKSYATVSGGMSNAASGYGSVIGGGTDNVASGQQSTVAGGAGNIASYGSAAVGGGNGNQSIADNATVAGGYSNIADGQYSFIGGGSTNRASDEFATVGGGSSNTASGAHATVPGGSGNTALGDYSFAAGRRAQASHSGCFIWGDSTNADFSSTWSNQFLARATGGVAFVTGNGGFYVTGSGASPNVAAGYITNGIAASAVGCTISGGGASFLTNVVSDNYGTVGGGKNNRAGDLVSDETSATHATVGGGESNFAGGMYSTIPGGRGNAANGSVSFAAGNYAYADHSGSFVWADNAVDTFFTSDHDYQLKARASGGVYFYTQSDLSAGMYMAAGASSWSTVSDRGMKRNIRQVDSKKILTNLAQIPISQWSYKAQDPSIEHIGPMAQDFHAAFGLGEDDKHINTLDPDGVALAAIQGLYELVQEKDAEISAQERQIATLEERLAALEALVLSK